MKILEIDEDFIMDQFQALIEPGRQFAKDSIRLVKRCTKPDRKGNPCIGFQPSLVRAVTLGCFRCCSGMPVNEYQKIAVATAIGFAIMGFIGFFVKLIHIPINNIIVGA
ncbi:protein translocase SEC61 complex gamma subunit, and eukaryotic [Teladorsagia circumcincta]|uniref:Protein translocase SEC61 complex gamma subunit, and eukaryotic n=1 Tax=Teladorsagia circumcincta TaxID=45464 RepID=A0A2G9V5W3_TELCI|nr:protein translocase SEC61 complex gamma subunit, and eukaryotic [Teladorsagia circumcincta]